MGKTLRQAIILANIVSLVFFLAGLYLLFSNKSYESGRVRGSAFLVSWPILIGLAAFIYFWKMWMIRGYKKDQKASIEEEPTINEDINEQETIIDYRGVIISTLQLWASKEKQLAFQKNEPDTNATIELFNKWSNEAYYPEDQEIMDATFSGEEQATLASFDELINRMLNKIPREGVTLTEFQQTVLWHNINEAAIQTLALLKEDE